MLYLGGLGRLFSRNFSYFGFTVLRESWEARAKRVRLRIIRFGERDSILTQSMKASLHLASELVELSAVETKINRK